ncbi:hypothetical protein L1887_16993 [Cichorium endivia]|nr:hypothetical protein L1887_16993 [Cichorium endivia]
MVGPANVWLAEHSLGASIAMLTGKNMAKSRYQLETYLFNPPIISVPVEIIQNETLKHGVCIAGSLVKAGIATAANCYREDQGEYAFVVSRLRAFRKNDYNKTTIVKSSSSWYILSHLTFHPRFSPDAQIAAQTFTFRELAAGHWRKAFGYLMISYSRAGH